MKNQENILNLSSIFLIEKELKIPELLFNIPYEYYKYSDIFKEFINKVRFIENVDEAYEWLGNNISIPSKNKVVVKWI